MSKKFNHFPKLRTWRLFRYNELPQPVKDFSRKAKYATMGAALYADIEFKNDKLVNLIIGSGALVYLLDRTPAPFGESVLAASFYFASKRSKKITKPEYDRSVLKTALQNLNSKDKSTPLSLPCDIPKFSPRPRV